MRSAKQVIRQDVLRILPKIGRTSENEAEEIWGPIVRTVLEDLVRQGKVERIIECDCAQGRMDKITFHYYAKK